jgi:RHS repeat-associated protein
VAGISFLLLLVLTAGTGQAVPTRTGHSLTGATVLTKIYGPDTSGAYGGSQGEGGLLGAIELKSGTATYAMRGVVSDMLGNAVARNRDGIWQWTNTNVTAYGPQNAWDYPMQGAGPTEYTGSIHWRGRAGDIGGLVYMGARYYDANTRTFLSADPLDYNAGINLYSYAAGDPVNFTDPDGRIAKQVFKLNIADASTGLIPVSMGLGTIGTIANNIGARSVGAFFNEASRNTLQFTADRWTAANQGPLGRAFDRKIYLTTGVLTPLIGSPNQRFLADWLTGNAPSRISYGQRSVQVRDMQTSLNVNRARNDFYAAGGPLRTEFSHDTVPAYADTIANPFAPGWLHSTAMQVGGYAGASIVKNSDDTTTYYIRNVAGANSFFLHVVPNLRGATGPMHNVEQVFRWTEPIDQARLRQFNP